MDEITSLLEQFNEEQADEKHEGHKRLDLPPEYDENDSRWTLKHPTYAEGLVELMKDSGVYVNAEKLDECEDLSSESNKLAQLLLTEIFTISALSACSWPGANANATDIDGGQTTPQLDEHATNILLKFVKEYAQLHEWELEECHCIVKHLRRIMLEMRQKKEREGEILVLPSVKNKSHSRWTLRYPEPAEGVVELMECSGVYVNADKLAVCLKLTKDCVKLARMLLSEIFTTHALSTCLVPVVSMPWPSTKLTKPNDTDNRPVLDKHAMSTLILFAIQYRYGRKMKKMNEMNEVYEMNEMREMNEVYEMSEMREMNEMDEMSEMNEKNEMYEMSEMNEKNEMYEMNEKNEMYEMDAMNEMYREQQILIQNSILQKMEVMRRAKILKKTFLRHSSSLKEDTTNSRGTLKYLAPAEGLVELTENSGVYVNAAKLAYYKKVSKDPATLAQKLLTEVFSAKALHTCSLSETNNMYNNMFGLKTPPSSKTRRRRNVKRELDAYAEIILLNFVDEYGMEQGVPVLNFEYIRDCMMAAISA